MIMGDTDTIFIVASCFNLHTYFEAVLNQSPIFTEHSYEQFISKWTVVQSTEIKK